MGEGEGPKRMSACHGLCDVPWDCFPPCEAARADGMGGRHGRTARAGGMSGRHRRAAWAGGTGANG